MWFFSPKEGGGCTVGDKEHTPFVEIEVPSTHADTAPSTWARRAEVLLALAPLILSSRFSFGSLNEDMSGQMQ